MSTSPARSTARPWLFSPALDLLVGCGGWSLPLLALTFFLQRAGGSNLPFAFYLLALFCNQPHYMATIYRAYHTAADFNRYRFFTVYFTVFALLTLVIAHLVPGLFPWLVTLYLSWSPWHYSSQNFGIAQMMLRRAGAPADPAARNLLHGSYVASFVVWLVTLHAAHDVSDPSFISLRLPASFTIPVQILGALTFLGCGAAAFVRLRRTLPTKALIPAAVLTLTQLLWFVAPALLTASGAVQLPASYFSAGMLAFMHCAQYLWVTTYFAQCEAAAVGNAQAGTIGRPPSATGFSFARYYVLLVVGGIALFIPGPWFASRLLGHDFVESFMIFTALVNLHHFILDGAVWKLRDGRIARLLLGSDRTPVAEAAHEGPSVGHHLGWLFGPAQSARCARLVLAGTLLLLAALDQWQYAATSASADLPRLAQASLVNPADPRAPYRRAQMAKDAGDLGTARRELEGILAVNPHNRQAENLLGEVLWRSHDLGAARALYDRMWVLSPDDLATALDRGLLALEQGDHAAAIASLTRAAQLAPANRAAHLALASELAQTGQAEAAIGEYEVFLGLFESAPGATADGAPPLSASDQGDATREYLQAALAQAGILVAQGLPPATGGSGAAAALPRAERRLQRTADIAATQHYFTQAATALSQLADLQEKLGQIADAKKNRALAEQAASFAK